MRFIKNFLSSEDGPTTVEYAVMLSLIVGACLFSIQLLSYATAGSFDSSANAIDTSFNQTP